MLIQVGGEDCDELDDAQALELASLQKKYRNSNNDQRLDDETTQYSVQASALTQNRIPHDTRDDDTLDYSDSTSMMGKSATVSQKK